MHAFIQAGLLAGALIMSSPASAAPVPPPMLRPFIRCSSPDRHLQPTRRGRLRRETAPDVDWVDVVGMHWKGRDAARRAHIALHNGMFATSIMSPPQISEMRELSPTSSWSSTAARSRAWVSPPGGTLFDRPGNHEHGACTHPGRLADRPSARRQHQRHRRRPPRSRAIVIGHLAPTDQPARAGVT